MDEKDFWIRLMYRLGEEFSCLPERRFRWWWCDGFIPDEYDLEEGVIRGQCWIGEDGSKAALWKFTLLLGRRVESVEQIDWLALYPPEDKGSWIDLDFDGRSMMLELSLP